MSLPLASEAEVEAADLASLLGSALAMGAALRVVAAALIAGVLRAGRPEP